MHIKDSFPQLYAIRRRPLSLASVRERLSHARTGKEYWRSLEELAATEEFEELLHREFPQQMGEWDETDEVGRRTFLKLMGASLALAGLSACAYQPPETIVPYVRQPEEIIPGKPLFFATAMALSGASVGLLVRSNMGRPTKIEGNQMHPASLGATDIFSQASILGLYDPDRSKTLTYRGEIRPYTSFLGDVATALEKARARQGAGLRFLTETIISPTAASQMREILTAFPGAKWHQYEPAGTGASAGARLAFGASVNTIYRFDRAERVLALDSDFLSCGPASLRFARDFASKRRIGGEGQSEINRLYAVETTPTNTGMVADHRLAVRPSEMEAFARAVASSIGATTGSGAQGAAPTGSSPQSYAAHADWIAALARDLNAHRGASIIIAGDEQAPIIHALAHAMNQALGNVGQTVFYTDPIDANPIDQIESLMELVRDIDAGQVETLVIVGGNPVYTTPADLKLDQARLNKVNLRIRLGLYDDETSYLCHWHIPEAHYLESWSDTRAFDGTASIVQPLIAPLYRGKTVHEFLAAFTNRPERSSYDIVRDYWRGQMAGGGDFEQLWRRAVHDGVIPETTLPMRSVSMSGDWASAQQAAPNQQAQGFEIVFRTDPSVYDGRFANNGWLQELPKPLTKLTWDNAALISPNTAKQLGLGIGNEWPDKPSTVRANEATSKGTQILADVVRLRYRGREVKAPVWIMPGQPDGVVTVHLGYGRTRAGQVGTSTPENPVGFDAYILRTSDAPWSGAGLEIDKTGEKYELSSTQLHFNMEGRDIVRAGTLEEYRHHPELAPPGAHHEPPRDETLYNPEEWDPKKQEYAWGMTVDLGACVGCNGCIVACQSENNIPVVGKAQVARSREMHWIRVDSYFKGFPENPNGTYFQPVPCMHCENAPCEPVCPVHATVHSAEGTNDMVYNRCVGTRYCSNNCPYKVRRFNFLLYQNWTEPTYKLMRNPEVTVRSRGVMEKCTYCIQRIEAAKIQSKVEGRAVRDGEIVTACQAVCPTEAIVFGNINDPASKVSRLKAEPRNYGLLAELNTRPRTTYLAAVRNPNPEIKGA